MAHRAFLFFRVLLLVLISGAARGSAQNLDLGVLEDVPGAYAGQPNQHSVRVLFQKNGSDWEAFPNNCPDQGCLKTISSKYPREVTWTIVLDGRDLGQVTGRTPKEFEFYSHVGLQEVVSTGAIPTVGKRSAKYGGSTDRRRFAQCLLHQWNRLPEAAPFHHPRNVRGLLIRPPPDRFRRPPAPGRFHPDGPSTRRSRAPPGAGSTATRRQATTRLHRPRLSWSTPDRAWTN